MKKNPTEFRRAKMFLLFHFEKKKSAFYLFLFFGCKTKEQQLPKHVTPKTDIFQK